jgi:hypothetical protein
MNLNTYYETISDIQGELFTEREFSQRYLGRSETYYGYLKCTNSEPSKSALVNLWHQLKQDCGELEEQAQRSIFADECTEDKQMLEGLRNTLLQEIMYDTTTDMQQH